MRHPINNIIFFANSIVPLILIATFCAPDPGKHSFLEGGPPQITDTFGIGTMEWPILDDNYEVKKRVNGVPFMSISLHNLPLPEWMRHFKFPYRFVFRFEFLALRKPETPKYWPNLIMGLDASMKESVPSRFNLKVFHQLSNGLEFGVYHKWFLPHLKYGCSTEYLFQGELVHAGAFPRFLENANVQNIHNQFDDIKKLRDDIFTKASNLYKKLSLGQFCDELEAIFDERETEKDGALVNSIDAMEKVIVPTERHKCERVEFKRCRNYDLRITSKHSRPIKPIVRPSRNFNWNWLENAWNDDM